MDTLHKLGILQFLRSILLTNCVFAISLSVLSEAFDWTDDAYIDVRKGLLHGGQYIAEDNLTAVTAFTGVPYAKPPLGQLRFKAPQELDPWQGRLTVRSFAPSCMQYFPMFQGQRADMIFNGTHQNPNISEDCLKLNIYIPRNISQPTCDPLPVIVYFHSGALQSGTGNTAGFRLSQLSGVIVVTVNYRLNVFGFLSTDDNTAPGNFGFLDQQMALRWVKDNIASLGGNSDSITIFGLSAGAWSVAHHTVSPGSRGLFNRVICQSGAILDAHTLQRNPRGKVEALAVQLNCSRPQMPDIIDCLREVPADSLIAASISPNVTSPLDWFMPVVDGIFLREKPEVSLSKGYIAPVDVLSGMTRFEGYSYPSMFAGVVLTKDNPVLNKSRVLDLFSKGDALFFWNQTSTMQAELLSTYALSDENDSLAWTKAFINAAGDRMSVAPNSNFLYHMRQVSNNTFMYLFDHRPSFEYLLPFQRPDYVGATHGDDLLFSNGDVFVKKLGTGQEQLFSLRLAQLFGQFARDGRPDISDLGITWEPWQRNNRSYLILHPDALRLKMTTDLTPQRTTFWSNLMFGREKTKQNLDVLNTHPEL